MSSLRVRGIVGASASLALVAGVLAGTPAQAASICNANNPTQFETCWDSSAADGDTIRVTAGYTIDDRLDSRNGDAVTIDLNGQNLQVPSGIGVEPGDSLTIDDKSSAHNGSLLIDDVSDYQAGIGGSSWRNGHITIKNGAITVIGGSEFPAIGGGDGGAGGSKITITGGTVNATGGDYGAGIGGSNGAEAGLVTITGGTVNAIGGWGSAGIGSGWGETSSGGSTEVSISGGTVNATGDNGGAGIGGGADAGGGTVSITGGVVKAASTTDTGVGVGAGYGATSAGTLDVGGTRPNPEPSGFIDDGGSGADTAVAQLPSITYATSGSTVALTRRVADVSEDFGSLWVEFKYPPTPPPSNKKVPTAPKKVKTTGKSTARKFVVRWTAAKSTTTRPVNGYRVRVNVKGCSKNFYSKKVGKSTHKINLSRSFLLKNSHCKRSVRGEVASKYVNYRVRVQAYNSVGYSKPATSAIKVRR